MAWFSLGTKQPGFIWEEFAQAITGDVAVRVTQTQEASEITALNKLYLSELYATGERRFLRTIYPSTNVRLWSLEIPQPLKDAGYITRYFAVKHNGYGVVQEANWTITLEVWL